MKRDRDLRYSIGIDLGTTNCALAFIDLEVPDGASRVLDIPQWETMERGMYRSILPSFAYYPMETDRMGQSPLQWENRRIVGQFALANAVRFPQRVIFSAKSWLSHGGIDREAKLLPWASDEIPPGEKLSPVEASALYLRYLREAWNQEIARDDRSLLFDRQQVVVTVPASFDQDAQRLTLAAAELAGYRGGVRLLEEPQAAFHAWMEKHPGPAALKNVFPEGGDGSPYYILVCDIGGGTTDLSLFSVDLGEAEIPDIKRIAVSEHILLGGDNIDLAMAKTVEPRLGAPAGGLSPRAWQGVINQCRLLKERALGDGGTGDEEYYIAIGEPVGHLFTETKTVPLRRDAIVELVNEGFFPRCEKADKPLSSATGLREMGLPYAKDSAVTRYLADFCSPFERIDAVLFNGGTLSPPYLQERIRRQIAYWQNGFEPVILENSELYLAVARGAAHFGKDFALRRGTLISAGASHGLYIEVNPENKKKTEYVVCIVPMGTPIETELRITKLDLSLLINQPVSFRPYSSVKRKGDHPGQILKRGDADFRPLPPLETFIRLDSGAAPGRAASTRVTIEARLNALGLLQIELVGADRNAGSAPRWRLEFNLRKRTEAPPEGPDREAAENSEPIPEDRRQAAFEKLGSVFSLTLLKDIERILGRKRESWNLLWLRTLWVPLYAAITRRHSGPDYEAAWLNAAGYFLRPGYGVVLDDFRLNQLWNIHELELAYPAMKTVREQYCIAWRRVSGGLSRSQQETLYAEALPLIKSHVKQAHEPVQMASAFELLPIQTKLELFTILLDGARQKKDKHCGPYLWALGRLLSRVPLYAGEDSVSPPSAVEECFRFFSGWDWKSPNHRYLPTLFGLACRKTNNRAIDVPNDLRARVIDTMTAAGARKFLIEQVRSYLPVKREDLTLLFGEALPSGLAIRFRP